MNPNQTKQMWSHGCDSRCFLLSWFLHSACLWFWECLFFYSCKRVFLQIHLLFHSSSQGEGAWHDPGQLRSLLVLGSPAPASISTASTDPAHCGHCVTSPGGLSSKAHGIFHCVPLSTVKKGIFNFILKQATK